MLKNLFNKFFINKKETKIHFTTDIHSHLIVNIDDGLKSLESSIEIIKGFSELGYKKLITTPHIMSHRFPNTKKTISDGYKILNDEINNLGIDIKLEFAAEYYYDDHFINLVNNKDLLTFGDNYILFELSYMIKPFELGQTVYKLLDAGYKPILAHPERYTYYNSSDDYSMLKDMGLYFQINSISMEGFYGKDVKKSVEKIINLGYVDFVGSDTHSMKYFNTYKTSLSNKLYKNLFEKNNIKNNEL